MNKTDIDKMFKEKILGHEKSSGVYKPEHWNNFEKQLDKALPVAKKSNLWFTLNNILIVLSVLTSIVLIPILILHSSALNKSSQNSQASIIANNISKSSEQSNSTIPDDKNTSSQNTVIHNFCINNQEKDQKDEVVLMNDSAKQKESATLNQNGKQVTVTKVQQITMHDSTIQVKNNSQDVTSVNAKKDSTIATNNVNSDPGNKAGAGNRGKNPHKKKKSKNILVQHLNYNGL